MTQMRLNHYPFQPAEHRKATYASASHCDYGMFTVLAPDPSGGLEVRTREGEWVAVPHHDGALLVNIGDMLSRWTNDRYVSTPHRVANTETSRRGRLSIAVFFHLDADTPVGGDLYATGGAPKYETVRYLDELVRKFEGNRMEVGAQADPSDPSHGAANGAARL